MNGISGGPGSQKNISTYKSPDTSPIGSEESKEKRGGQSLKAESPSDLDKNHNSKREASNRLHDIYFRESLFPQADSKQPISTCDRQEDSAGPSKNELSKGMNSTDYISDKEIEKFSELRNHLEKHGYEQAINSSTRKRAAEEAIDFLESLTGRNSDEASLESLYSRDSKAYPTRQTSQSLQTRFQGDIKRIKFELEKALLIDGALEPVSKEGIEKNEIDQQIREFITGLSGADFDGLSIRDKITTCFKLCDDQYKENKSIPERFQALVDILKSDMNASFIKNNSRVPSTSKTSYAGEKYLLKSGMHEFVRVKHRVENFLMSIGQHPTKSADIDYTPHLQSEFKGKLVKLSFNDVYESLKADTSSLMFYKFDESGNKIIDPVTGEVAITGGGHPGAALRKLNQTQLEEKLEEAQLKGIKKISQAVQSVDGSFHFHQDLSEAFYSSRDPLELVKRLYDVFNKHCFNGSRVSMQEQNDRIMHISLHRLHSSSKKPRRSFASEMNLRFEETRQLFVDLVEAFNINLDEASQGNLSDSSSGSSETTGKSDPKTYIKYKLD